MRPTHTTRIVALLSLATMALAGCTSFEPTTETPDLEVTSSAAEARAGETVRFQAEAPFAVPGAQFVFDFGDGETLTVEADSAAEAEHSYEQGGHYTLQVSLMEDDETVSSGSQSVHIIETQELETALLASGPLANETSRAVWELQAGDNATGLELELRAENTAFIGQSLVYLAIYDNGTLLDNDTVTLGEGDIQTVFLASGLEDHENLTFEAIVESGSASIGGVSKVRFD